MSAALLSSLLILAAGTSAEKSGSAAPDGGRRLERLEVVCGRDRMTVHVHFRRPFLGLVFSHGREKCVHVGPGAGVTSASFDIRYDGCGTTEDLGGRFHENTIVVQFDEDVLEAGDEAKRLRCEWIESFEKKQSSRPVLAIADLDAVELNFQGDDIDCWMEIQEGKGPWSRRVAGLVPVGSPLTLVVAIDDRSREFDVRVKRCTAGDGTGRSEVPLTDGEGCVLRPSLLTPFAKVRGDFGGKATLVAYSHLHAFKFPDRMDVYVHCVVEVCRHGCADACDGLHHHPRQKTAGASSAVREIRVSAGHRLQTPNKEHPSDPVFPGRQKNAENRRTLDVADDPVAGSRTSQHGTRRPASTGHRIVGHDVHWFEDGAERHHHHHQQQQHRATWPPKADRGPLPEPSPWSANEVRPLSKQEVFRSKEAPAPIAVDPLKTPYVTRILWSTEDADSRPQLLRKESPQVPQPEPAAWTFEGVRGSNAVSLRPEPEPRPEPASWTFDDAAAGLHKDGLGLLVGRNHEDSIRRPHVPGTVPQPVYVSSHTPAPRNLTDRDATKGMGAMMMMMMSTALPPTYRTAHWPGLTTVRYPRPLGHRYPYPVPQFSPHQRLMTNVVADRRSDEEDLSPHHNPDAGEVSARRVRIGETAGPRTTPSETADGDTPVPVTDPGSELVSTSPSEENAFPAVRSAVSGFVPPSLDPPMGSIPETGEESPTDRRKKRSTESVFGVRQMFRAVAPSDLAFEWNLTAEGGASVLRGRREGADIVYGVCLSPAGMGAGVGLVLVLTLLAIVASAVLYEHSYRLSRKTSRLSFLARNFDGRLEALYRITTTARPHPFTSSSGRDVG